LDKAGHGANSPEAMAKNLFAPKHWNLTRNEMESSFRDGTIAEATPEQLKDWLLCICTANVD